MSIALLAEEPCKVEEPEWIALLCSPSLWSTFELFSSVEDQPALLSAAI